jgi:hypothetical protein
MQAKITKEKDKAELKLTYKDGKWRMAKGMEHAKGKGEYPVLEVKESKEGQFTFKISNQDDVTFAEVPFGPMAGADNPSDFAEQFQVRKADSKKIVVDVRNANPKDPEADYAGGVYTYELRFDGAPPLDPIITNGGCCKALTSSGGTMSLVSESAAAGIALGAAALVVVLAARWRRARS